MKQSILLIAFDFLTSHLRQLADNVWKISILTVNMSMYGNIQNMAEQIIPQRVKVSRARCFDTASIFQLKTVICLG